MKYLKSIAKFQKDKLNLILNGFNIETVCFNKQDLKFYYKVNGICSNKKRKGIGKIPFKIYMYVHFIPNIKGIRNISISDMCNRFNCSRISIINSMKILHEIGFVYNKRVDSDTFQIIISEEHSINNKDAKAYLSLSSFEMREIISLTNINEMKVELKKALWVDAKEKIKTVNFNENKFLNVLPSYMNEKSKIDVLYKNESIFKFENGIFSRKVNRDKEYYISNFKDVIKNIFKSFDLEYSFNSSNCKDKRLKDMEISLIIRDICKLCVEYSLDLVVKAIAKMKAKVDDTGFMFVKNTPAYLRYQIENNF